MENETSIIQKNITISTFHQRTFYGYTIEKFGGITFNELPEMEYHSSWDWLMPVIEKIESLGFTVFINGRQCSIWKDEYGVLALCTAERFETKILTVFTAVHSFCNWYNKKKTNATTTK